MKNITTALGLLSLVALLPSASMAQAPGKNIPAKTSEIKTKNEKGHSRLTGILESVGFSSALGSGAYTIFAPTDGAFAKLPASRLSNLLRPENRSQLKEIMARHVLPGNVSFNELKRAVSEGNGVATFRTLGGDNLTFKQSGSRVLVSDNRGHVSAISASNQQQGASTIYSVDTILL